MRAARVFISCGQRTEDELGIGLTVEAHFRERGFETFFAEAAHSPEGLTEHIFKYLAESEYFVFIDFRRDPLEEDEYRGSLFVNQELAVATYLRIPGLGFVESGVKREGIANYHIHNAIVFRRPEEIFAKLHTLTNTWDITSVRELALNYVSDATTHDILISNWPQGPRLSDWYHLEVRNCHKERHALSCMGYLTRITDKNGKDLYALPSVELMWAAIQDMQANIMARTVRDLDAFYVVDGNKEVIFHQRGLATDNPRYHLPRLPPGSYLLEYTVVSSNFADASTWFRLGFDGTRSGLQFEPMVA